MIMGAVKIVFAVFLCILQSSVFCAHHTDPNSNQYFNFDITGRDFSNTQVEKLCLLARLNVSILFTYTAQNSTSKLIMVPRNASRNHSYCDYEFVSLLQLDFDAISFRLNFTRDRVQRLPTSPIGYCEGCDTGNWWLASIGVNVANTSAILPSVPPTTLRAYVNRSQLATVDGGFSTGVSLKRGYRCKHSKLIRYLDVEEVKTGNRSVTGMWTVKVNFHWIEVQPFLVTNDIVKDPLLCKDYTLFLVFIILIPILYFVFFITFYRLRDKYGCPDPKKKFSFKRPTKKTPDNCKQQLLTSKVSSTGGKLEKSAGQPESVLITCTAADSSETRVIACNPDEGSVMTEMKKK